MGALLSAGLGLAILVPAAIAAEDPPLIPPNWNRVPDGFATGATAALSYTGDAVLLFSSNRAWAYEPLLAEASEAFDFPFPVHAAVRWDADEAILFSDDLVYTWNLETDEIGEPESLISLGLPEGWLHVDAAAWFDDERWILFHEQEFLVMPPPGDEGELEGPFSISDLGLDPLWRDIDAAVLAMDGYVSLFRGGRVLDLSPNAQFVDPAQPLGRAAELGLSPPPGPVIVTADLDFGALPPPFSSGLTAGVCLPEEECLLVQGRRAILYSPWTREVGEPFMLDRNVDAALRWDESRVALFSGSKLVIVDLDDESAGIEVHPISRLGVPSRWPRVTAAVVHDSERWLLFNGDEFMVYALHGGANGAPAIGGPFPLAELGLGYWADGFDALMNTWDGRLVVVRGDGWSQLDVTSGTTVAPVPFIPETN